MICANVHGSLALSAADISILPSHGTADWESSLTWQDGIAAATIWLRGKCHGLGKPVYCPSCICEVLVSVYYATCSNTACVICSPCDRSSSNISQSSYWGCKSCSSQVNHVGQKGC